MSLFCLPNKMADLNDNVLQKNTATETDEQFQKMEKSCEMREMLSSA